MGASREDLALCPGLGPQKVRALGEEWAPSQQGLPPLSFKALEIHLRVSFSLFVVPGT